ncbi:xyloglucan endotransglucosylase protein 1-like [Cryptomeria japonica]|uniref:xyloglucan endotransglucosylase protein 1-like n=1 Tax=Cryptomeria japonica TaxID=3369 RepID=UPI0027DA6BCA|nr:xyloglucan endotransglucosylase protein 1-like [Cryptomeria japonica]
MVLSRFSLDGTPVRVFKNNENVGVTYPKNQGMRIYSSLWNTDDWATRGGLVKIDWSKALFVASYQSFNAQVCSTSSSDCSANAWYNQAALDSGEQQQLEWVRKNYMVYDYCSDTKRFPLGLPTECTR